MVLIKFLVKSTLILSIFIMNTYPAFSQSHISNKDSNYSSKELSKYEDAQHLKNCCTTKKANLCQSDNNNYTALRIYISMHEEALIDFGR